MASLNKTKALSTDSLVLEISPEENKLFEKAAKRLGLSKSDFLLTFSISKAIKEIRVYFYLEAKKGVLFFKNRKLEVFHNILLFTEQETTKEVWASMHDLPIEAIEEAFVVSNSSRAEEYNKWCQQLDQEDQELLNFEPH